jgi:hypothetical protein
MTVCGIENISSTSQDEVSCELKSVIRMIHIECDKAASVDVLFLAPATSDQPPHEGRAVLDFAPGNAAHFVVLRHGFRGSANLPELVHRLMPR